MSSSSVRRDADRFEALHCGVLELKQRIFVIRRIKNNPVPSRPSTKADRFRSNYLVEETYNNAERAALGVRRSRTRRARCHRGVLASGYGAITTLTTYAAWLEVAQRTDAGDIEATMNANARSGERKERASPSKSGSDLAVNLAAATPHHKLSGWHISQRNGGADGTRTRDPRRDRPVF